MHRPALRGVRGATLAVAGAAAVVAVAAWTVADLRRDAGPGAGAGDEQVAEQPGRIVATRGLHDAVAQARDEAVALLAPAMGRAARIAQRDAVEAALRRDDEGTLRRMALRELELGGAGDGLAFIDGDGSVVAAGNALSQDDLPRSPRRRTGMSAGLLRGERSAVLLSAEAGAELWGERIASIACLAPVLGPDGIEGAVVVCVRLDRIRSAIDSHEAIGIELTIIDSDGLPAGIDPTPCAAAGEPTLRGLARGLAESGARGATVDAPGGVAHAASLPWASGGDGRRAFVAGVADAGAVAGELGHARMVGVATAASLASLGLLAVGLLVQSRTQRRAQVALVSARNEADAASRSKKIKCEQSC